MVSEMMEVISNSVTGQSVSRLFSVSSPKSGVSNDEFISRLRLLVYANLHDHHDVVDLNGAQVLRNQLIIDELYFTAASVAPINLMHTPRKPGRSNLGLRVLSLFISL